MFSDPKKNIQQLGISEGMDIADFGSGSGHYTQVASNAVGDSGKVYAIEVQQNLLKKVKDLSNTERKSNIEVIWGDIEKINGTKLSDNAVDAVIFANIAFQLEDRETAVAEALRILKPKGRILMIDWSDSFGNIGPRQDDIMKESVARQLFENTGFEYERNIDAGEHHYGLVFRKI